MYAHGVSVTTSVVTVVKITVIVNVSVVSAFDNVFYFLDRVPMIVSVCCICVLAILLVLLFVVLTCIIVVVICFVCYVRFLVCVFASMLRVLC